MGLGAHLSHHTDTMHPDGLFSRSEFEGNLLVEHVAEHGRKDLTFPRRRSTTYPFSRGG